jgi:hypothetical protein
LSNNSQIVEGTVDSFWKYDKNMKRVFALLVLLMLMACGGENEDVPTEMPAFPTTQSTLPAPTSQPDSYPQPTANPANAYPARPRPTPTLPAAYFGLDPVWVTKAVGAQCQGVEIDVDGVRLVLENAGIQVLDTTMISIPVCEACDTCPTSEHYRFFIPATDIAKAEALGWTVAE